MERKTGMVFLVGAGPGDPELLTIKGKKRLSEAEVLVYDRLASPEFLDWVPEDCVKIYVGKEAGRHSMRQEEINQILVDFAKKGKKVVRLKGGDPFVFGRGGEEILELERHGIFYEVVPGITSAIAALSHAGIPVTHRMTAQSFHVITGHTAFGKDGESTLTSGYREYARLPGTLVFLMGLSNLESIVESLLSAGKDPGTPAAVVCNGTLPEETCIRASLRDLPKKVREAGLKPPGIIVVGETAAFRFRCQTWDENIQQAFLGSRSCGKNVQQRPLSGVLVGITGTDAIYEKLSGRLSALGARTFRASVSHVKRENEARLLEAVRKLKNWDWILFTSRNGVKLFFETVRSSHVDYRSFAHLKFAVVGSGTEEALESFGFQADYMPKEYTTEALARGFCESQSPSTGNRILIPRARQGARRLPEILTEHAWSVTDLPIYDIETENSPLEELSCLTYLTFESGSGVRGFFKEDPEAKRELLQKQIRPVCIGAVTKQALSEFGVFGALMAERCTVDGIAEVIMEDKENGDIRIQG